MVQAAPDEKGLYTHYVKTNFDDWSSFIWIPKLDPAFQAEVQKLVLDAHNAIGALDVSRIEIRCDETGVPYLLEINTLPGMCPGYSDLAVAAELLNLGYLWVVNAILNLACLRYGLPAPTPEMPIISAAQPA